MDNKDRHLTPEQQKLAADNHNLIYSFAVRNKMYIQHFARKNPALAFVVIGRPSPFYVKIKIVTFSCYTIVRIYIKSH